MKKSISLLILMLLYLYAGSDASIGVKNKQKYSFAKSKYIDCGSIELNEMINEDENIDESILVINLTSHLDKHYPYLNNTTATTTKLSFSTHLSQQVNKTFSEHFKLDRNSGLVFLTKSIDRESICTSRSSKRKRVITNQQQLNEDSIDCECKSDKCELRFKFNAFRDNNNGRTTHHHLLFTVQLNDINDNFPVFKKNYLILNASEFIGENTNNNKNNFPKQDNSSLVNCPFISRNKRDSFNNKIINDDFLISNYLIPLETTAVDLDSSKYSNIKYDLILLKSKSCHLIDNMESIRDIILKNEQIECNNEFELVETSLNENSLATKMLFLKVNKYLDREQQDCYNFALIATDQIIISSQKQFSTLKEEIKEKNYMLIKLLVNDLNDNIPKFEKSKYIFNLNETTELSTENDVTTEKKYYFNILKQTCLNLKSQIRVKAVDGDLGLNGLINYKLIQQVHRKNVNFKSNLNKILQQSAVDESSNFITSESLIDHDALFSIDKQTGSIYLKVCEHLNSKKSINRQKFIELTLLLDYELYTKHILVVEAIDSSTHNPLQSFVTLEINIFDMNDQTPDLISLYSKRCSINKDDFETNTINITIQRLTKQVSQTPWMFKNYTSKLIIDGVSEWSFKNTCLGQFLVTDLDLPVTNRKLEAILVDSNDNTRISTEFSFRNLKTISNLDTSSSSQHEIFELFLNFEPDAEFQKDYRYTLILKDQGDLSLASYVEVIVLIQDENDNEPKFEQSIYHFKIDEWFHLPDYDYNELLNSNNMMIPNELIFNYCIGNIEAIDLDRSNQSAFISYSIVYLDHADKNLFYFNQTNKCVSVYNRTLLDREQKSKHTFFLYATNNESINKLNSSVQIEIILNDLNDNRPQFPVKEFSFYIPETDSSLINSLLISTDSYNNNKNNKKTSNNQMYMNYIGQVMATDRDVNQNADLKYYLKQKDNNLFEINLKNNENSYLLNENDLIVEGIRKFKLIKNIEDFIFVNATTGRLYLLKGIDREQITHIRFNLHVIDRRNLKFTNWPNEPLSNVVPVVIELIDINDQKPICSNLDLFTAVTSLYKSHHQKYIYSIYFDLDKFKTNPIYHLNCYDKDLAKNSELLYELSDVTLKEIDSNNNINNNNNNNKKNNIENLDSFMNLFEIDSKSGVLYYNYNWYSNQSSADIAKIYNNYFFVLKFKISDNGMIPSFNYYTLKLKFCLNISSKYCDLDSQSNASLQETNRYQMNNLLMQRLNNVDEDFNADYSSSDRSSSEKLNNVENSFSTEDFDDVSFINEDERHLNDMIINNKTSLKTIHPYPNSYSSFSSSFKPILYSDWFYLILILNNICRWLYF
jgi:hypothetical protein